MTMTVVAKKSKALPRVVEAAEVVEVAEVADEEELSAVVVFSVLRVAAEDEEDVEDVEAAEAGLWVATATSPIRRLMIAMTVMATVVEEDVADAVEEADAEVEEEVWKEEEEALEVGVTDADSGQPRTPCFFSDDCHNHHDGLRRRLCCILQTVPHPN